MTDESKGYREGGSNRSPTSKTEGKPSIGTTRRVGGSTKGPGSKVKPAAGRHPVTGRYVKAPQQASVAKGKPQKVAPSEGAYGGRTHPSA
jgi:hypothetical protein